MAIRLLLPRTAIFILALPVIAQTAVPVPRNILAIRHVTVIDATGAPAKPDMTVLVVGERIGELGKSRWVSIPKNARVIDATGLQSGFTPMEALQSATRNPAIFLGILNSEGTVERGKIADLGLRPHRDVPVKALRE